MVLRNGREPIFNRMKQGKREIENVAFAIRLSLRKCGSLLLAAGRTFVVRETIQRIGIRLPQVSSD
jgi:hypothetical protein